MTFGFKALGTKDEVIEQLKAYDDTNFGDLGKAVRDLIVGNLEATSGLTAHSQDQWGLRYVVEGHGHGDANSISVTLKCDACWVPQAKADEPGADPTPTPNTDVPAQSGPVG